jgi:diguanylate cyclase (GGDEF)-like protein/PAS domain S-box-containing protein
MNTPPIKLSSAIIPGENAESFYRSFFDYSMDAVLLTSPDGTIAAANPAACQLFRRTEAEICRGGRGGVVDPNSPYLKELLEERARTGRTRGELIFVRGDGSRFPGEFSSALFTDTDGKTRTVMIIRDISNLKRAEQTQKVQEQLLFELNKNAAEVEAILASQEDTILVYSKEMNVLRANPAFIENYGFDPVGLGVMEIIQRVSCRYPDGRPLVLSEQPTPRALRGEKVAHVPYAVTRADGTTAIVETSSRPLYVENEIIGTITLWHDITEIVHAEETLKRSAEEIEDLYNHAPCGYHSLNKDGMFVRINETELSWLGYTRDEIIGKLHWHDLITPRFYQTFKENFPAFMKQGYIKGLEYEIRRKDGSTFYGLLSATAILDADGNFLMSRGTVFDISERKAMEEEMRHMAQHDALTGLPNRTLVFDRLQRVLSLAKRNKSRIALIFLDLDQFKQINDTLGHEVGDLLLQEAARRMQGCVRESDTVGRLGGDEFVVILPEVEAERDVTLTAEKIRQQLEQPFLIVSRTLKITSSIGIAVYPEHGDNESMLVRNADTAMYRAKERGGNKVIIFEP